VLTPLGGHGLWAAFGGRLLVPSKQLLAALRSYAPAAPSSTVRPVPRLRDSRRCRIAFGERLLVPSKPVLAALRGFDGGGAAGP